MLSNDLINRLRQAIDKKHQECITELDILTTYRDNIRAEERKNQIGRITWNLDFDTTYCRCLLNKSML